jgi:subtilase family serine protease
MPSTPSRHRRALGVGGLAVAAVTAIVASGAGTAFAGSGTEGTLTLSGTVAPFVAEATEIGATPASAPITFDVTLGMRDEAGAEALLTQLSTPGSPQYGQWLTTAEFRQRFGATDAQVAEVTRWLTARGLHVGEVAQGRMSMSVTGSASAAAAAFGTKLNQYSYKGRTLRANATDLRIPLALRGVISGVTHLDESGALKTPATAAVGTVDAPTTAATSNGLPGPAPGIRYGFQPCSAYYAEKLATNQPKAYGKTAPYDVCGYTPKQYASAYGISDQWTKGHTGKGVTIAITDAYASPTMLKDANTYAQSTGQAAFTKGQYSELTAASYDKQKVCDPQGWYGEESLDVESAHGLAPGANILYVGAKNCDEGLDNAWATVIDKHLADIVTNSWGFGSEALPASYVTFFSQYSMQAALTGITDNFSSGDDGDSVVATGKKVVSFPATLPYVTAVGGTSVGIGKSGNYLFETGWSTAYSTLTKGKWAPAPPGDYNSGSGGGTSKLFKQPAYQKGKVPTAISEYFGRTPARTIPDISMPGDPNTGMRVGQTQSFPNGTYYSTYRLGGTSLSSPLLAGVVAVADSAAGKSLGFLNPAYYKLLGTPALHDVTGATSAHKTQIRIDYNNFINAKDGLLVRLQTLDVPTTIRTRVGYDDETGVGSPNGAAFFSALSK